MHTVNSRQSNVLSDLYPELRAISNITHREASVHVCLDDIFRHEQTDTGTLQSFGAKVWLEYFADYIFGNTTGIVSDGNDCPAVFKR